MDPTYLRAGLVALAADLVNPFRANVRHPPEPVIKPLHEASGHVRISVLGVHLTKAIALKGAGCKERKKEKELRTKQKKKFSK